MKTIFKRIIFSLIVLSLLIATGFIVKVGKFEKLEGYMYSFAVENDIYNEENNATSGDAEWEEDYEDWEDTATGSNATSGDADWEEDCEEWEDTATSSDATSSNATSSNPPKKETITVKNPDKNAQNKNDKADEEEQEVDTDAEEVVLYNSKITKKEIEDIKKDKSAKKIVINLDNKTDVSKDIFEAIKGKNITLIINSGENRMTFYGENIKTAKKINAKIACSLSSKDALLKGIEPNGIIVDFANNGELPGEAKIEIKATSEIKEVLKDQKIVAYHYNEETKELTQVDDSAKYNEEGYIEFVISHNSKYLLVNKQIEEKEYTVEVDENVDEKQDVSFLESNIIYVLILGVSVTLIIVVIIILIVDKKKNKQNL